MRRRARTLATPALKCAYVFSLPVALILEHGLEAISRGGRTLLLRLLPELLVLADLSTSERQFVESLVSTRIALTGSSALILLHSSVSARLSASPSWMSFGYASLDDLEPSISRCLFDPE